VLAGSDRTGRAPSTHADRTPAPAACQRSEFRPSALACQRFVAPGTGRVGGNSARDRARTERGQEERAPTRRFTGMAIAGRGKRQNVGGGWESLAWGRIAEHGWGGGRRRARDGCEQCWGRCTDRRGGRIPTVRGCFLVDLLPKAKAGKHITEIWAGQTPLSVSGSTSGPCPTRKHSEPDPACRTRGAGCRGNSSTGVRDC